MKVGDIVKFKHEAMMPWLENCGLTRYADYFLGELEVKEKSPKDGVTMYFFAWPSNLAHAGRFWGPEDELILVRSATPEKCKWFACGKLHNDDGLCK